MECPFPNVQLTKTFLTNPEHLSEEVNKKSSSISKEKCLSRNLPALKVRKTIDQEVREAILLKKRKLSQKVPHQEKIKVKVLAQIALTVSHRKKPKVFAKTVRIALEARHQEKMNLIPE